MYPTLLVFFFTLLFGFTHAVSLETRQFAEISPSSIPSACKTLCDPTVAIMNKCGRSESINSDCLCTDANFLNFGKCADCYVAVRSLTEDEIQHVEEAINGLGRTCGAVGKDVPHITVAAKIPDNRALVDSNNAASAISTSVLAWSVIGMVLFWL